MLANADTGLPQKAGHPAGHGDAFFFGNSVGNSGLGDTATNAVVNATDESGARLNPAPLLNNIPITNIYDYDRNATVNATDQSTSRLNTTNLSTHVRYLNLTGTPAAPEADGGDEVGALVAGVTTLEDRIWAHHGVASTLAASPAREPGVPQCLSNRIENVDLTPAWPARHFHQLQVANTLRSGALLRKYDAVPDQLDLDDAMLDLLFADLGLE